MSAPSLLLCSGQIFENVTQYFSLLRAHPNEPENLGGVGALKRTGGVGYVCGGVGGKVKWAGRAMENPFWSSQEDPELH